MSGQHVRFVQRGVRRISGWPEALKSGLYPQGERGVGLRVEIPQF